MLTDILIQHNRWDRLSGYPRPAPAVTVVVTHYEQHHLLGRMASALRRQSLPPRQVVLADDGSARTPAFTVPGIETVVVSQPDQGFRAGTARNLAVERSTGEVLVFLDADTVPEPGYVEEIVRHVGRSPDVLAVGRRRHASFAGLAEDESPGPAAVLPEPAWLADAYAASGNLLHADGRSFRFLIGAVLCCRRSLFHDLGGFDERFVDYGGEDWDFAYRAWNAGAVLVHERDAVAWHEGPDWAGRGEAEAIMEYQSARLAALIPEPATRGAPLPGLIPDVLADVHTDGAFDHTVRTVHALLRQTHRDLAIRLPTRDERLLETYASAVRTAPWTEDQLRRARVRFEVRHPLPETAVERAVALISESDAGLVELVHDGEVQAVAKSTRAVGRARRWSARFEPGEVVEHAFGRHRLPVETDDRNRTLAGFFARWE
ncbi:glycosyltransferase [Amycolatopsis sp. PS_44_ISF1]|uniref:glycosyltransferase n=1 Tax=Amycolatopsis sp. PS_44_ISF1 TaxID=2974917 RepID=UPI0028DE7BE1|nr:glycosyltransferase [Amycolatopsis sp. PS_44_ISF1]MDT8913017.1 glycosyltransferase [Amycolatopsis sp. PS_44_ISF1]